MLPRPGEYYVRPRQQFGGIWRISFLNLQPKPDNLRKAVYALVPVDDHQQLLVVKTMIRFTSYFNIKGRSVSNGVLKVLPWGREAK